jgi:hypothetical protein
MRINSFRNSSMGHELERRGLQIRTLKRGSELTVRTRNSVYAMVVLSPLDQTVLIRGGHHFRSGTEATLLGSSSLEEVHPGRISTLTSLGILANGRGYVTSPVEAIECDCDFQLGAPPPPLSSDCNAKSLHHLFQIVAGGRVTKDGNTFWVCPLGNCRRRIETSGDAELRDRLAIEHSLSHVSRQRRRAA